MIWCKCIERKSELFLKEYGVNFVWEGRMDKTWDLQEKQMQDLKEKYPELKESCKCFK
jgi:transcriptional accessory protein Tex/SPT6